MSVGIAHVGDIGTIFEVTFMEEGVIVDIHLATTKEVLLKPYKPTGTALVKSGVFKTDGTDGILTYATIAGDLSAAGQWQAQGHVILPAGEWHSTIHRFDVEGNLA